MSFDKGDLVAVTGVIVLIANIKRGSWQVMSGSRTVNQEIWEVEGNSVEPGMLRIQSSEYLGRTDPKNCTKLFTT